MDRKLFYEKYHKLNIENEKIDEYSQSVTNFEFYIKKDIKDADKKDIKKYIDYLIKSNNNTYNNVIHFARCFYYLNKKVEYIHMTKYFNTIGVLENIIDRITLYESKEKQEEMIKEIVLPPFGTDSEALPKYTKDFMKTLTKHLPKISCQKVLAGNNHRLPKEVFLKEKELYDNAKSFSSYLKDRHERKVEELKRHYEENIVWFEQIITKEAIEYVASNQEILSGVIRDDKLYITKIPYEIDKYLKEEDNKLKRYYACHCSFVRESILSESEDIPKEWCNCSAGFAKFPFEIIFGRELDVKLLKTPIDGDDVCRFVIDLSTVDYK